MFVEYLKKPQGFHTLSYQTYQSCEENQTSRGDEHAGGTRWVQHKTRVWARASR